MTTHSQDRARRVTLQTIPMPADTVVANFISAGWLLAEMDKAAGKRAHSYIGGRAVTVGVEAMAFHHPVYVGDLVVITTEIVRQGRTSVALRVEAHADRRAGGSEKVTEGIFTFVATDGQHRPAVIGAGEPWRAEGAPPAPDRAARRKLPSAPPALTGLSLRDYPDPRDTNYLGDIFGGWILAQMDKACAARALRHVIREPAHHVATVGIEAMTFHKPVFVGDEVSFYTEVVKTGRTSVTIRVETWAARRLGGALETVTEGLYSYVALDQDRRPLVIAQD